MCCRRAPNGEIQGGLTRPSPIDYPLAGTLPQAKLLVRSSVPSMPPQNGAGQISTIETVSLNRSHGGTQGVYKHLSSATGTTMTFSVYVPPQQGGARLPVVWYLSGLTCTHANVTEKGE